ncbi:phasin family protein [Ectothiorhodospiraceae bacterium WFHF3C12]|nr:phasin family protein [Ectothiorhodospiraceae bacterium WFHF3C12]
MQVEFLQNALNPFGINERLGRPGRKLSALMVDNAEKLVNLHLDAARVYTDIGLSQLRAVLSIHDPESLQQYVANQATVAESVVKRATEDAETVAGIGNDFANDASRIASENVSAIRDAVSPGEAPKAGKPKTTDRRTNRGTASAAGSRAKGSTRSKAGTSNAKTTSA